MEIGSFSNLDQKLKCWGSHVINRLVKTAIRKINEEL